MSFKKIIPVLASLIVLCGPALRAGDAAIFVNLGFSPDGAYYMFAQYGVRSGTLRPWADLSVIDVARNDFVQGGRLSYIHDRPIVAGQDGMGAMHSLIARNARTAERHNIIFPNQGQPLYIALCGGPAFEGEEISFRDFTSGIRYRARLTETVIGEGNNVRSSFFISLTATDEHDGRVTTHTIGTPQLWRPLILSYRIRKVLIAPTGDSLIFVIQMRERAGNTHNIRYMVEALRL